MAHELSIPNGFLTGNQSTFGAGTTALAPIQFTLSGAALETSVDAGDLEADSNGYFYYTQQSSSRQVVDCEQFITLTSQYTTPTGTAGVLKQLFNVPTNGTLTVAGNTTYFFECCFTLGLLSGTTGTFSFGFGGTATYTRVEYLANANKANATSAIASNYTFSTSAAATVISPSNTSILGAAIISGKLVIGTGGTIIPSVAASVAAGFTVGVDSYFRLQTIGLNTLQSVGNWS